MKLLLDANISYKLIPILNPIFEECKHVDFVNLNQPPTDLDIWNYALKNEFIIVTKDNDFVHLSELYGYPPKTILLRTGNNTKQQIAELLINAKPHIEDLVLNNYGVLEIINNN